ncbi:hypothetical protein [uncultured Devosia sp.]|uniref:hypothetical protein n=1 Tax=uncultured Devosia sp. TaxID=211434 RepID=UPI00261C2F16|nr:hypothetical protein [uncultured Devosia sp.]
MTAVDVTADWYWEGNVVRALAQFLSESGWTITGLADTRSKARGVDLEATKAGETLVVEAKGYPSSHYRDPRKAAEKKSTNPASQAQQWYSHALLKGMRLQNLYPESKVALAFPDFPRYRTLYGETEGGLRQLGIGLFFVRENGEVTPLDM